MFGLTKSFFTEVSKEMKKVSWPTQEQLRESTMVVIVTTLIITALVFVIDQGMTYITKFIY